LFGVGHTVAMSNHEALSEHAQELAKARQKLEKEFADVRESLGDLHLAYQAVTQATVEDDMHGLLKNLQKAAKEARDGGLIGSGANAHRRALKKFIELRDTPPEL
jgi:Skp family chaperone for outer membrane proteins